MVGCWWGGGVCRGSVHTFKHFVPGNATESLCECVLLLPVRMLLPLGPYDAWCWLGWTYLLTGMLGVCQQMCTWNMQARIVCDMCRVSLFV